MTLCFLLMVYIIIGWIIEDPTFVVIYALMFNPAQYLSVYLKAKGFMNISIILFEILPILIAVISVSLYSELVTLPPHYYYISRVFNKFYSSLFYSFLKISRILQSLIFAKTGYQGCASDFQICRHLLRHGETCFW